MACEIPTGFIKGERFDGIRNIRGRKAGVEQNWGYYATDTEGNECALLYCNPGLFTIIDRSVLGRIRIVHNKQVSWYQMATGYMGCHTEVDGKSTCLTLHQVLMDHYGHGKEGPSIDHINRNKLDNRLHNLRVVTQSIQNSNKDKVARHRTAKDLPPELDDEKLPIFVVYYKEKLGKTGDHYREFFTVEGHPIQREKEKGLVNMQTNQLTSRRWATTKSNSISINEKLGYAKAYVEELNKLQTNPQYILGVSIIKKQTHVQEKQEEKEVIVEEKEVTKKEPIPPPKQWKAKQIHHALHTGHEHDYKTHCEQNNDLSLHPTWSTDWDHFLLSTRGLTEAEATPIITAFVENLRRIRHNHLCHEKNASIVDKEDRRQWPATTVVRAFLDGKLDRFKVFTEASTGEDPADSKWVKRWANFVTSLEGKRDQPDTLKTLCSKFMTAQRTKKYRHQMGSGTGRE